MAAAKVASQAYLETKAVKDARVLIADLCKQFYSLGWVSGTGGSITIKAHDDSIPKRQQLILMSPSGVQKERMEPDDMYVLATNGILSSPSPKPYPHKPPKCSDCAPLFLKAYDMRNAGAVIHSHGIESCLVTMINLLSKEIRIEAYQKTTAVLVRNHGIYIWGDSWISAKTQCCIVLDIEGTTTPITFVADVLFPYARDNVGMHLSATYETAETHNDIKLLCAQVEDDLKQGIDGAVPIPTDDARKEEGHIWRTGYENNELEGVVYGDVPEALEKWHALGIKVYIYSSGSRLAQRLIFGKTNYGDLRKYLSGF